MSGEHDDLATIAGLEDDQAAKISLKERGGLVESMCRALRHGETHLHEIPSLIRRVIETGAWRERVFNGETFTHTTFASFVTTKRMAGCGWSIDKVEALLKDEPTILPLWRGAVTPPVGAPGHGNSDNITIRRGTSKAYILDRLKRERPDLFERVCAGELSANAAAIEAGFRKKPQPRLKTCPHCGGEL